MIAAHLIGQTIPAKSKRTFAVPSSSPNAPSHALEHKVQMQRKQQIMSVPAPVKRITTTSNMKVALPAKDREKSNIPSQYTMADTLFSAPFFSACLRHADDVGMANIAPSSTREGRSLCTPEAWSSARTSMP